MFGLKKREPQAEVQNLAELGGVAEATSVIVRPRTHTVSRLIETEKQASYEEIAKAIGFAPAELVRAQLLAFFERERIDLYNYGEVDAWLKEKKMQGEAKENDRIVWCWRPLREKDVITDYNWGFSRETLRWLDGFYSHREFGCSPYQRLVPQHALEKVVRIEKEFGDKVKFFVSDYASPKPDPFIMVRTATLSPGGSSEYNLVFDMWDEPGFGL